MSLDARSPFVFDTHELGRRPGAMHEVDRTFELPELLGTDILGVPAGAPFTISLRCESVLEGVWASGSAQGTALGGCARCLDPLTVPVDVEFGHLYTYPDKTQAEDDENDDVSAMEDELIDVLQPITDVVVLALPFQPLCSSDCPGLCSQCGVRMADEPDHTHEVVDPRWTALQDLKSDLQNRKEK